jgi:hypothetical protein
MWAFIAIPGFPTRLRLASLSEELEELGRRDSCAGAADLLEQLAGELARLAPAMQAEVAQRLRSGDTLPRHDQPPPSPRTA